MTNQTQRIRVLNDDLRQHLIFPSRKYRVTAAVDAVRFA